MQKLLFFYRYTFYWAYEWSLRKYGAVQGPEITGLGIAALCVQLNIFALVLALDWLAHLNLPFPDFPKPVLIIVALLWLAPHYWYLVRGGRYRVIAAEFDAWDADRRWYMNRRVIFYIIGSFATLFLTLYLLKNFPDPLHLAW